MAFKEATAKSGVPIKIILKIVVYEGQKYSEALTLPLKVLKLVFKYRYSCGQIRIKSLILHGLIMFAANMNSKGQTYMLLVMNDSLGQAYFVKSADKVKIVYNGYLRQPDECTGLLSFVSDTSLFIQFKKHIFSKKQYRQVKIKDLHGIRLYKKSRIITESITNLALLGGSVLLYTNIYSAQNLSPLQRYGLSFGTGLGALGISNLLFSIKIKHDKTQGWRFLVTQKDLIPPK